MPSDKKTPPAIMRIKSVEAGPSIGGLLSHCLIRETVMWWFLFAVVLLNCISLIEFLILCIFPMYRFSSFTTLRSHFERYRGPAFNTVDRMRTPDIPCNRNNAGSGIKK